MILEMTEVVQGGIRQERKLETIANHLANSATVGFKRDVLSFDAMFNANMNIDFTPGDSCSHASMFVKFLGYVKTTRSDSFSHLTLLRTG